MSLKHGILRSDTDSAFRRIEQSNPHLNAAFYNTVAVALSLYIWRKMDGFTVQGAENIPQTGSFIAAANHTSHLDHGFVGKVIHDKTGRHVNFMAKDEFWLSNWGALKGRFVERGNGFPTNRNTGRGIDGQPKVRERLDTIFDNRGILVQYPEGTRMKNPVPGKLFGDLKTGAAKNSIHYQVPVLPIGLAGIRELDAGVAVVGKLIMPPQVENRCDYQEIRGPAHAQTTEIQDSMFSLCTIANGIRAQRLAAR